MREVDRIIDQLQRAFNGDAWSGPSLQGTLEGITAAQAAAHPLTGVHSIGELVRHLTTWTATVAQRIQQQDLTPLTDDDWPAFATEPDENAWQLAQQELWQAHTHLLEATAALPDTSLDTILSQGKARAEGSDVSPYVLLHGTAQHYLYHAGQVALLRKFI